MVVVGGVRTSAVGAKMIMVDSVANGRLAWPWLDLLLRTTTLWFHPRTHTPRTHAHLHARTHAYASPHNAPVPEYETKEPSPWQ